MCKRPIELIEAEFNDFLALGINKLATDSCSLAQGRRPTKKNYWADKLLVAETFTVIVYSNNLIDQHSGHPRHLLLDFHCHRKGELQVSNPLLSRDHTFVFPLRILKPKYVEKVTE